MHTEFKTVRCFDNALSDESTKDKQAGKERERKEKKLYKMGRTFESSGQAIRLCWPPPNTQNMSKLEFFFLFN